MVPRASVSSPVFLGGGGGDALGPAIARPGAEADMPEARALGKLAISPVGSTTEVEQAAVGATQPPPQRVEGAPESSEEAPALAPRKALKVSTSSTAQWVVEAQAAIQRDAASARADPKESVAQGGAAEAATEQAEGEEPTPRKAEARESDEAEVPSVAEATEAEAEALRTSEAEAIEAGASRTTEAEVAEARAPRTTEAEVAEVGVGAAEPAAWARQSRWPRKRR
ncbi:uncharacterized protein [Miscanthus floridulus]|uniref:uncharacterized protein n=1 Tax=Miscanthus floridulus TaxID=154761 RepID=UPI003458BA95